MAVEALSLGAEDRVRPGGGLVERVLGSRALNAVTNALVGPQGAIVTHGNHFRYSVANGFTKPEVRPQSPVSFEDGTSGQGWTPNVTPVSQLESEH